MPVQNVNYYHAFICTCVAENFGNYDPKDDCFFGWRFEDPVNDVQLTGELFKLEAGNFSPGTIYSGECKFLIPSDNNDLYPKIGKGDVLVNTDQLIKKTCNLEVNGTNAIPDFNVSTVLKVSYKETEYIEGSSDDYTVELQDNRTIISWTAGGSKPDKYYSVEYVANVNYHVWDVLPVYDSVNQTITYKSAICKLRYFGDAGIISFLDSLDITIKPGEFINV